MIKRVLPHVGNSDHGMASIASDIARVAGMRQVPSCVTIRRGDTYIGGDWKYFADRIREDVL
ncbi:hypothetical protein B7486_00315 [cyanobacterium TDX16]|nr:hypothetical protein B7486_00315 [cyanobacterium TDX16]